MKPQLQGTTVVAHCPDCGARSTFESHLAGAQHQQIIRQGPFDYEGRMYAHKRYQLLRCASCGRGGLVTIAGGNYADFLVAFYPISVE